MYEATNYLYVYKATNYLYTMLKGGGTCVYVNLYNTKKSKEIHKLLKCIRVCDMCLNSHLTFNTLPKCQCVFGCK